jgi:hypothetical protein
VAVSHQQRAKVLPVDADTSQAAPVVIHMTYVDLEWCIVDQLLQGEACRIPTGLADFGCIYALQAQFLRRTSGLGLNPHCVAVWHRGGAADKLAGTGSLAERTHSEPEKGT